MTIRSRGMHGVTAVGAALVCTLGACSTTGARRYESRTSPAPVSSSAGPSEAGGTGSRETGYATTGPVPSRSDLGDAYAHVVSTAPLAVPRRNFFHSTLDVPPLDTARTLPKDALQLRLNSTHARSRSERNTDGRENDFDGTFHDWIAADLAWGGTSAWEFGFGANFAGWDEHQDRFEVPGGSGQAIISDETIGRGGGRTSRHMNLSTVRLHAKRQLGEIDAGGWDLAVAPALRIPIGRERDITHAGTWDASLTGLGTLPVEWGTLHANLGVTWPLGDDSLFRNDADVDIDAFAHGGVALVVPINERWSGIVQIEANSSAFEDVEFLDEHPVTFVFGARRATQAGALEFALGTGLDRDAAYQLLFHVAWAIRF